MRRIFHGSNQVIERPKFGLGKPYNDYGLGFYCTEHQDMAKEWSVGFNDDGFANEYLLHDDDLVVLDLGEENFTTLHWLSVLLENRTFDVRNPLAREAKRYLFERFSVDLGGVDVVEGYRADDSYFSFAQDFLTGAISYRQLSFAMNLGGLGKQVVLKSQRAFERIEFVNAVPVLYEEWFPRRHQRDQQARNQYFEMERGSRGGVSKSGGASKHNKDLKSSQAFFTPNDLFITQILSEEIGADDVRLR